MKKFSQRDPKWSGIKLGFSNTSTIGGYGCKLTSFGCISGIRPDKLNEQFKKDGCFFNGDLLSDVACAKSLGWNFVKKTTDAPKKGVCIAEVDMSPAPGKQQHFVVYRPSEGVIIDPWTGTERPKNTYPFVSFRIFGTKPTVTIFTDEKSTHSTSPISESTIPVEAEIPEPPVAPPESPVTNETPEVVSDTQTQVETPRETNNDLGTIRYQVSPSLLQRIIDSIVSLFKL